MKRTLPLVAALAATLTAPLAAPAAAQDMSAFLNPGALAAQMGLTNGGSFNGAAAMRMPTVAAPMLHAPSVQILQHTTPAEMLAALTPDVHSLAPRTSMAPIPRGAIARIVTPDVEVIAPAAALIETAPLVHTSPEGVNTVVISGANTAVIQTGPSTARPSFWQRWFGS